MRSPGSKLTSSASSGWTLTPSADRRRHKRFGPDAVKCAAWVIYPSDPATVKYELGTLVNISSGGICFSTELPLMTSVNYRLLLEMIEPMRGSVLATARVCWIQRDRLSERFRAGAAFVESDKGWVGPEDDVQETRLGRRRAQGHRTDAAKPAELAGIVSQAGAGK
jgi:hypothetical protein